MLTCGLWTSAIAVDGGAGKVTGKTSDTFSSGSVAIVGVAVGGAFPAAISHTPAMTLSEPL